MRFEIPARLDTASMLVAPASLVVASGTAFLISEFADFAIYTPLQQRRLMLAVVLSPLIMLAAVIRPAVRTFTRRRQFRLENRPHG